MVIGAFGNDGNGSLSGHARVFQLSWGNWIQVGGDIDGMGIIGFKGASVSWEKLPETALAGL
jgi:hypothetical protein